MTVKKTICAALSFIMILVMAAMPVSAIQVDDVHVHNGCCEGQEEDVSIQPKYVVSCPGGSKHAMYIKGQAYVYKGTAGNQGDLLISHTSAGIVD